MLYDERLFLETYRTLEPEVNAIVQKVLTCPPEWRVKTGHIDRPGAIVQYVFYISLMRRYLTDPNAVVVDWGAQFGQVSKLMSTYWPNTDCYVADDKDPLQNYWLERLGVNRVKFAGGDYRKINLPDSYADALISSGVLEHTYEFNVPDTEALAEIYRVLKPGGLFFIWNLPHVWGSVEILNGILRRWHHSVRYTAKEARTKIEGAGLQILELERHEFVNMATRNAMVKLMGPKAFGADYYLSKIPPMSFFGQHLTIVVKKPEAIPGMAVVARAQATKLA